MRAVAVVGRWKQVRPNVCAVPLMILPATMSRNGGCPLDYTVLPNCCLYIATGYVQGVNLEDAQGFPVAVFPLGPSVGQRTTYDINCHQPWANNNRYGRPGTKRRLKPFVAIELLSSTWQAPQGVGHWQKTTKTLTSWVTILLCDTPADTPNDCLP